MSCCGKRSVRYIPSTSGRPRSPSNPISVNYSNYRSSSNPISSQPTSNHIHDFSISQITLSGKTYNVHTCKICGLKKVIQV